MDGESGSARWLFKQLAKKLKCIFSQREAYPMRNAVLFHRLFFHKVFGVQRRGEQQKLTRSF